MKVRYMLDENLSPRLKAALKRLDAEIDILRVGDESAPELGTSDPEVLQYLTTAQRILVTDNRSTIPIHLQEHYGEEGSSHWGVLWIRPDSSINQIASSLYLIRPMNTRMSVHFLTAQL